MCRIAAYLGPPIDLERFFRAPEHSLYRQSWAPREMLTATVNADGYGIAWLDNRNRPALYRSHLPAWADANLDGLIHSLNSSVWVGNVRSATAGLGTHVLNTQPFTAAEQIFTHNGFISDFAHTLRRRFRERIDPEIEAVIQGNTDSEYLFALLRQVGGDPASALRTCVNQMRDWTANTDIQALLNMLVTDGNCLYASRAAINADCPSLYYHGNHPEFPGGVLIASEAFDETPGWRAVPAEHLLTLKPGTPAHCEAL